MLLSKLDDGAIEGDDHITIRANPSRPSSGQSDKVAEMADALGVKKGDAFILINYTESARNFEIDRHLYRILYHTLKSAHDHRKLSKASPDDARYRPAPTNVPFLETIKTFLSNRSPLDFLCVLALLALCAWSLPWLVRFVVSYVLPLVVVIIGAIFFLHDPTSSACASAPAGAAPTPAVAPATAAVAAAAAAPSLATATDAAAAAAAAVNALARMTKTEAPAAANLNALE